MKSIFVDVEQNTDEWWELKLKKLSSSSMGKIMANYGKAFGEPAVKLAQKIALEIVTGVKDATASFSNKFMERGHEYEGEAIERYELEKFCIVANGGFYYEDSDSLVVIGDSPDGNVGDDGCVEVKTVIRDVHWIRLEKGGYDTSYKWQIQNHIVVGNKKWCDFISYCPEMPYNKQAYIYRVMPDLKMIGQMAKRKAQFVELVSAKIKVIQDA